MDNQVGECRGWPVPLVRRRVVAWRRDEGVGRRNLIAVLAAGLWHDSPGGYAVHDYLDFNPSRSQTLAKRNASSNAARKRWASQPDDASSIQTVLGDGTGSKDDPRPTHDQIYLVEQIEALWQPRKGKLTIPGVVRLNQEFGVGAVTSALRQVHGFPPEEAIQSPYAYVSAILQAAEASA